MSAKRNLRKLFTAGFALLHDRCLGLVLLALAMPEEVLDVGNGVRYLRF